MFWSITTHTCANRLTTVCTIPFWVTTFESEWKCKTNQQLDTAGLVGAAYPVSLAGLQSHAWQNGGAVSVATEGPSVVEKARATHGIRSLWATHAMKLGTLHQTLALHLWEEEKGREDEQHLPRRRCERKPRKHKQKQKPKTKVVWWHKTLLGVKSSRAIDWPYQSLDVCGLPALRSNLLVCLRSCYFPFQIPSTLGVDCRGIYSHLELVKENGENSPGVAWNSSCSRHRFDPVSSSNCLLISLFPDFANRYAHGGKFTILYLSFVPLQVLLLSP